MLHNPPNNSKRPANPIGTEAGPGVPAEAAGNEYVLSFMDLLSFFGRWLWPIASVAVLFTGASVGYSLVQTPMYQASIMILVGQERDATNEDRAVDAAGLQRFTRTVAEGIDSRPIAEGAIRQLDLGITANELLDNLEATQVSDTQFIRASYRDPSPERAQRVANAIGDVSSEQISEVSPSANAITATVWERAQVPGEPVSPRILFNALLALGLGLMIGTLLAYLLEYLDNRRRSPEEVEQISGVPNLGVIPEVKAPTDKKGRY